MLDSSVNARLDEFQSKRPSKDHIAEKTHISERTEAANQREKVGHWEADLVICKRSRPVLVLHERKTRLTLISVTDTPA